MFITFSPATENEEIALDVIKVESSDDADAPVILDADNRLTVADDGETLEDIKLQLHKELNELLNAGKEERSKEKRSANSGEGETNGEREKKACGNAPNSRMLVPLVRKNSLNLIANTTVCIFQWNKSWYRCFICTEAFPDMGQLRTHSSEHSLAEYERRIKSQQNRLIKAEVSLLECKRCHAEFPNLTEMLDHLSAAHSVPFHGVEHLLVPFKIGTPLICQLCGEEYDSFRLLNVHVNRHYTRQVCDACGATFSSRAFLNLHRSRTHRQWRCERCALTFETRAAKADHDRATHCTAGHKARFPCPRCERRFPQEGQRARHLVEVHGAPRPEHRCELCEKAFITRGLRNGHVRSAHRRERTQGCDLCSRLFFSRHKQILSQERSTASKERFRSDAARHRVTHTGERRFECESCGGTFATKGSLNRHTTRSHATLTSTSPG